MLKTGLVCARIKFLVTRWRKDFACLDSSSVFEGKNDNTCLCSLMTTYGVLAWGLKPEHKYIFLHHCTTSRTNIVIFLQFSSRGQIREQQIQNNKWLMKIRKIFFKKEFLIPSVIRKKISNKQIAAMYIEEFLLMHKRKQVLLVFLMFTGNFEAI